MLLHHFAHQGTDRVGDGPRNYVERSVHWQLDLDGAGSVLGLTPLHGLKGRLGVPLLIPDPDRTSGVAAALGTDLAEYVLGWQRVDRKTRERVPNPHTPRRQQAFRQLIDEWTAQIDPDHDPVPHAVAAFYRSGLIVDQPLDGDGAHYVVRSWAPCWRRAAVIPKTSARCSEALRREWRGIDRSPRPSSAR
ncbi:hypothetical protein FHR81_000076 [Actinoalloteichus hoggarensis]|uniref:CRISPR-associated protein (Cas_Csd1) n=1 Tax=Actinoalloteichus hoggarensis TaxID=1470176 RepID=A0A221W3K7_9PSEU|nr:type I-C CRISPR-associated protein Cas8c/Csd1 [Actinoalloteichus hoggarensis]ASO20239.1 CRISPR-associated protein (Cas_Csd1) [Actinoalloteichus hoggarensis]MBB5919047.1 hypothetical protein [Actinoalloteichus hoggarensis]